MRAGLPPAEARRQALILFGGREAAQGTDARRDPSSAARRRRFATFATAYACCRRTPGFTAAALITLALGIGATSAIFSVVRTVMLEPLPYREPDRLVTVWETNRGGTVRNVIAPANFVAWRERSAHARASGHGGPASPWR